MDLQTLPTNPLSHNFLRIAFVAINLIIEPSHFFRRNRIRQLRQNFPQRGNARERILPHEVNSLVRRKVTTVICKLHQIERCDATFSGVAGDQIDLSDESAM